MTYSIKGSWCSPGGDCDVPEHLDDIAVYQANINNNDDVAIQNPGGPFNGDALWQMQEGVDQDTFTCVDGSGHDRGDTVEINFDNSGCDTDIVKIDASEFSGSFCMNVIDIQSEDCLYMSNVKTFTAVDENGDPISPVFSQNNVDGKGNGGDQNGKEFGEGTYDLDNTGGDDPAGYKISYIDRNGCEQEIWLEVCTDECEDPKIKIDFICFNRGTLIECEDGMKRVEDLVPGDRVRTKDHGFQPLQWIASRKLGRPEISANPQIRPIRIRAGALGPDMPAQDLLVSPQHRMLVEDWRCEAMFGEAEMLMPAKALVNDHSVTVDHETDEVEYFHFMFEQHEIVYANGVESESFHPGDFGLSTLDEASLEELLVVFPHLAQDADAFGAPARPVLRAFEARAMMQA